MMQLSWRRSGADSGLDHISHLLPQLTALSCRAEEYEYYYSIITYPMDFGSIKAWVGGGEGEVQQPIDAFLVRFIADMRTVFINCRRFNQEGSAIFRCEGWVLTPMTTLVVTSTRYAGTWHRQASIGRRPSSNHAMTTTPSPCPSHTVVNTLLLLLLIAS